jgi:hypothetical protein
MSDCCQAHAEESEAVLTLVGRFMRKLLGVLEAQTAIQTARVEAPAETMQTQEADTFDLVSFADDVCVS